MRSLILITALAFMGQVKAAEVCQDITGYHVCNEAITTVTVKSVTMLPTPTPTPTATPSPTPTPTPTATATPSPSPTATPSPTVSPSPTATPSSIPCKNKSCLPWKSGASPGTSDGILALEKAKGFGEWRGRAVDISTHFIGSNSFSVSYDAFLTNEVLKPDGALVKLKGSGIEMLLAIPLVTKADAGKFAMVATGVIDAKHQAVANKIKSYIGDGSIYIRLGWEADQGYPWSFNNHDGVGQPNPANPVDYRNAWSRIARIYKTTLPGSKLVWNKLKEARSDLRAYYPGDDAVDVISLDLYDNGFSGGYCSSATSIGWIQGCLGNYDAATGKAKGLIGTLTFAKLHGKQMALDEWGATNETLNSDNGADNDFFVKGVFEFLKANASFVAYDSYYNRAGGGRHQIWPKTTYNPRPSDAYLKAWHP